MIRFPKRVQLLLAEPEGTLDDLEFSLSKDPVSPSRSLLDL